GGQLGRLAGAAHPLLPQRALGRGGDRGRDLPQRLEQVRPETDLRPAASTDLERTHLAARVSVGYQRTLFPPAAPAEGRPGPARRVLYARLQPGLDQPRRLLLDRGADRRAPGRAPRRPHAGLERDGVLRRLRPADGARLRAPRPAFLRAVRRPVDRVPAAR